ncbi:hypothetical protein TNCT_514651 [Trichonephila clavata]|uniref:Uncharacterized protein n=1 Tax=Trichonephila clavata TaxID=2740835 RepID=A0A8X6LIM1_TRICU|nr:hypothetical protein TNCT_514651 [Trichonephila clavata]
MIDKAWRAVTLLTIHHCFKKSGFPASNLVDVHDTLTECNAEPSLWAALPGQDLMFAEYAQGLMRTSLDEESYLTQKFWLWITITQKVKETNRRS